MKKLVAISFLVLFIIGCEKEDDDPNPVTCDAKGTYSGPAVANGGGTNTMVYQLRDNNFAIGYNSTGVTAVTWGGYRNTCDSVVISAYHATNGHYYLLKGAFSSNRTVLTGTFNNLTNVSDFGTFTMNKL